MSNTAEMITAVATEVEERMRGEGSGHDWWHVYRVHQTAVRIAEETEGVDETVVALASLLHDIADWKFNDGDDEAGPKEARRILTRLGAEDAVVEHVTEIIRTMSFKGAGVETPMSTVEGEIVQDADRLDAIGAIGIGRTFAYGGHASLPMYDPDNPVEEIDDYEAYKERAKTGTTINHFYEKLLLLADRMNTEAGRQIAEERTAYMEEFVERFLAEWDGKA